VSSKRSSKQQPPRRLEAVPPTMPRRLQGDALFAWATMQEQARQLNQQMTGFAQMQAQEMGFDLDTETIDPVGYIRPIQREPIPVQVAQNGPSEPQDTVSVEDGV
jgi:hypothetical protein